MLLEDRPRVTGPRRKELGDHEPLLGLEVLGKTVVELVPELRDAFAIVGLEGIEEPGEEVFELGVVFEEAVPDGAQRRRGGVHGCHENASQHRCRNRGRQFESIASDRERALREGAGSAGVDLDPGHDATSVGAARTTRTEHGA